MKRILFAFALSIGASSCSSCESCKGSSGEADGSATSPTTDAAALPIPTPSVTETAPPTPSADPMDPNYSCRLIARAITTKACGCPQKNKMGCCLVGMQPVGKGGVGPSPYVSCSSGKTDWPASGAPPALCRRGVPRAPARR